MPGNTKAPSKRKLAEFCKRHKIRQLARLPRLSDGRIQMLAVFDRRARVGLMELVGAERELSKLLQRRVLIVTPGVFKDGTRERILKEAHELYSAVG